jgi:hypothetical protein
MTFLLREAVHAMAEFVHGRKIIASFAIELISNTGFPQSVLCLDCT